MAETKLPTQHTAGGKGAIAEDVRPDVKPGIESSPDRETDRIDQPVSETWAEDTIAELDDFIESQGIYLRQ